jgi:hypothetical protein
VPDDGLAARPDRRAPTGWLGPRAAAVLAVLVLLAAATVVLWAGRHRIFFSDEWGLLLYRREGGFDALFAPHNGHLQATLVAAYRLGIELFGIDNYTPYRVAGVLPLLAAGGTVFLYARRRLQPEVAVLVIVPLVFMAFAGEALLWPYIGGFLVGVASLVGCLLLLDGGWRWRYPAIGTLLGLALLSSGLGALIGVGLVVEALLRRERERGLWLALGVPLLLYAAWFLLYRPGASTPASLRELPGAWPNGDLGEAGFSLDNLGSAPGFVLDLAQAAGSALVGLTPTAAGVLPALALLAAILALAVLRPQVPPRLAGLVVVLGSFWLTTALARGDLASPFSPRYAWVSAALLLVLLIEVGGGLRLRRLAVAALALGVGVVLVSDLRRFEARSDLERAQFAQLRSQLLQLEREGAGATPAERAGMSAFLGMSGGVYFPLIEDLGSPVSGDPPDLDGSGNGAPQY